MCVCVDGSGVEGGVATRVVTQVQHRHRSRTACEACSRPRDWEPAMLSRYDWCDLVRFQQLGGLREKGARCLLYPAMAISY